MTCDLTKRADALDRRASQAEVALRIEPYLPVRDLATTQRVLAAVLRVIAAEHRPEEIDNPITPVLCVHRYSPALAHPCNELRDVLAALASLFPEKGQQR